jgi:hypothetical protein
MSCRPRRSRASGTRWFNMLAMCRSRPLCHASFLISCAKLPWANEIFFRSRKKIH